MIEPWMVAIAVALVFVVGCVTGALIYDMHATKIHEQNVEQFSRALDLYQKEIDILKAEIENSNANSNRK